MKVIRTRTAVILLLICLSTLLYGCSSRQKAPNESQGTSYQVRDFQGTVLTFSQKPQRIVSLTLATDEILVDLVSADRICALTNLSDDSGISNITEKAKQVPKRVKANAESVIALNPDVVIVADWQATELIKTLRDSGIKVYVYKTPNTIEEVKMVIKEIAHVVGEEEKGQKIIVEMDKKLALVKDKVAGISQEKRKTVVWFTLMGGSGGKGSMFDDICRYAGVVNGAAKAGLSAHDVLPKEKVVEVNPDIFIMPTWDYGSKTDVQKYKQDVQNDPAFQTVKAVKDSQLIMVADSKINCSSQNVVYGVFDMAKAAYPELF